MAVLLGGRGACFFFLGGVGNNGVCHSLGSYLA